MANQGSNPGENPELHAEVIDFYAESDKRHGTDWVDHPPMPLAHPDLEGLKSPKFVKDSNHILTGVVNRIVAQWGMSRLRTWH